MPAAREPHGVDKLQPLCLVPPCAYANSRRHIERHNSATKQTFIWSRAEPDKAEPDQERTSYRDQGLGSRLRLRRSDHQLTPLKLHFKQAGGMIERLGDAHVAESLQDPAEEQPQPEPASEAEPAQKPRVC